MSRAKRQNVGILTVAGDVKQSPDKEGGGCQEAFTTVACQGDNSRVLLRFTDKGKQAKEWEARKSWGLSIIVGDCKPGLLFTVQLLMTSHKQVANGSKPKSNPSTPKPVLVPTSSRPTTTLPSVTQPQGPLIPELPLEQPESANPLWSMTFQVLNASKPELTPPSSYATCHTCLL